MYKIIPFLKQLLPFVITLFIWRLAIDFWNPAGILALIPIFYYTFIRPVYGFVFFGVLFCFLIDYNCDLPLFWTCLYCLFYALNNLQNFIDIREDNALYMFMLFIGIGILILMIYGFSWLNIVNNLWLFVWMCVLYTPITAVDKWAKS